jgi:hypothetical protein
MSVPSSQPSRRYLCLRLRRLATATDQLARGLLAADEPLVVTQATMQRSASACRSLCIPPSPSRG